MSDGGPVAHVKLLGHTDARVLLARAALTRRHRPRHFHSRRACLPAPASCTACLTARAHVRVVPAPVRSCVPVPIVSRVSFQEVQARFCNGVSPLRVWIHRRG